VTCLHRERREKLEERKEKHTPEPVTSPIGGLTLKVAAWFHDQLHRVRRGPCQGICNACWMHDYLASWSAWKVAWKVA
jgi:hypothetical protein